MYKYLFGPVPSRRLGMSLGVDLVPHKTCSLDCIYCECGETTNLTVERREYVPVDDVLREIEDYFQNHPDPDYITFSGAGEPCLNSRIGEVLEYIRKRKPHVSIAVLTNGTLFDQEEVRKDLLGADLVMPSLDAALEPSFQVVNRPHASINIETYIEGLAAFRAEFKGKFALEIFILPGRNDVLEDLAALKAAAEKINPDIIQLNTLDRPGAVSGISSASRSELEDISDFFKPLSVEIIGAAPDRRSISGYRNDMESAILETIARRPCTLEDLATILSSHVNEINKYLGGLEEEGEIEPFVQERGLFYRGKTRERGMKDL